MLLLHVLSELVFVKFFLYLRPAREEGPSSLAGIAVFKVVVYTCFYFCLCISGSVVAIFLAVNRSSSIPILYMLLHMWD